MYVAFVVLLSVTIKLESSISCIFLCLLYARVFEQVINFILDFFDECTPSSEHGVAGLKPKHAPQPCVSTGWSME